MNIFIYFFDSVRRYKFENNEFIPYRKDHQHYVVEKCYNGKFFKLLNCNCWIMTTKNNSLWWFSDLDKCYFSGSPKQLTSIYESPGVFVNDNINALCYRTSKTGSSAIYQTFQKDIYDIPASFIMNDWKYRPRMWKTKNEYDKLDKNKYLNFFVYRDPLSRLMSQLYYIQSGAKNLYPPIIRDMIMLNVDSSKYIDYILAVMEINQINGTRDEYHVSHQQYLIDMTDKNPVINYMVNIKSLKTFVEDVLKIEFIYAVTGGKNDKYSLDMFSDDELEYMKSVTKCDYDLFEKYKGKLYE